MSDPMETYIGCLEAWDEAKVRLQTAQVNKRPNDIMAAELAEWQAEQNVHKAEYDGATLWVWGRRMAAKYFGDTPAVLADNPTDLAERLLRIEQAVERMAADQQTALAEIHQLIETVSARLDATAKAATSARPAIQMRPPVYSDKGVSDETFI